MLTRGNIASVSQIIRKLKKIIHMNVLIMNILKFSRASHCHSGCTNLQAGIQVAIAGREDRRKGVRDGYERSNAVLNVSVFSSYLRRD
jgi:hypothetical protein